MRCLDMMLVNNMTLGFLAACLVLGAPARAAEPQPEQLLHGPAAFQDDNGKAQPQAQQSHTPARFGNYPCDTNDCAADKAGYRWAREHGITDADSCTGNSGAFIEGCRVYALRRSTY